MTPIENAIALAKPLVKKWEGFSATPYLCAAGVWTIGYGTTQIDGKPVTPQTPSVDLPFAEEFLEFDLRKFASRVLGIARAPGNRPNQPAALLSFAYNLGVGALRSSTLLRLHNAGRDEAAAEEFPKWVFAGGRKLRGLLLRRLDEKSLYLS